MIIAKNRELIGDTIVELGQINQELLDLAGKVSNEECAELCEIVDLQTKAMKRLLNLIQQ